MNKGHSFPPVKEAVRAAGRVMKRLETVPAARWNLANRLYLLDMEYTHPLYPEDLAPVTLTFASDIHAGPLFSDAQMEQLKKGLEKLPSDLLLFGGDLGDEPEDSLRFASAFPADGYPLGVFLVFGNHDLKRPGYREKLREMYAKRGWSLLENSGRAVNRGLYLCGTDDALEGNADLAKALRGRPDGGLCVLVSHNPDPLANAGEAPFQLALCGHTHGGQVAFRGHSVLSSSRYRDRYRSGWIEENGHDILVTNGIGTSVLPVRIGAEPQLIRLRIRHGERDCRLLSRRSAAEAE